MGRGCLEKIKSTCSLNKNHLSRQKAQSTEWMGGEVPRVDEKDTASTQGGGPCHWEQEHCLLAITLLARHINKNNQPQGKTASWTCTLKIYGLPVCPLVLPNHLRVSKEFHKPPLPLLFSPLLFSSKCVEKHNKAPSKEAQRLPLFWTFSMVFEQNCLSR